LREDKKEYEYDIRKDGRIAERRRKKASDGEQGRAKKWKEGEMEIRKKNKGMKNEK
jgi:hypothetical protein